MCARACVGVGVGVGVHVCMCVRVCVCLCVYVCVPFQVFKFANILLQMSVLTRRLGKPVKMAFVMDNGVCVVEVCVCVRSCVVRVHTVSSLYTHWPSFALPGAPPLDQSDPSNALAIRM